MLLHPEQTMSKEQELETSYFCGDVQYVLVDMQPCYHQATILRKIDTRMLEIVAINVPKNKKSTEILLEGISVKDDVPMTNVPVPNWPKAKSDGSSY